METAESAQQSSKSDDARERRPIMAYTLWGVQALLALVYLAIGSLDAARGSARVTDPTAA